jgi:hypothetical protein
MAARFFFTAALVAVHSFGPVIAEENPATLTTAPKAKRTPSSHHDLAKRQAANTYPTNTPLPLTQYHYPYNAIPEQVNPFAIGRGPQSGYNRCNSTTEGATSECQTMVVNSLADFCLWGSPTANGLIGNVEAAVVAYCSQAGHGTRIMPAGTITGAQFMKTSAYIQVTGRFNQNGIGLATNDTGGELDPHGADLAGNPLGGLVYSNSLPSLANNNSLVQAVEWNNFVGSGVFCIKLCDPTVTTPNYCQNTLDLLGCSYNMPASYADGQFTSCQGDLQDVVGVYTSNGQTLTWSQPSSLPATSTLPWTPRVPASSNCVTYSSAQLYGANPTASPSGSGAAQGSSGGTSRPSGTGTAAGSASTNGAAGRMVVSSGLFALLGAVVMLL